MRKLRIYLDTSIASFAFAEDSPDFQRITIDFFARHAGRYDLFASQVVLLEIGRDTDEVRRQKMLDILRDHSVQILPEDRRGEIESLARAYLERGAIPPSKVEDALHVAFASVYEMDLLLSWNFRHLANMNKEARVRAINIEAGYRHDIRLSSPLEVEDEAENDESEIHE